MTNKKSKSIGFTLIEIVVAMLILALLTAVATQNYSDYQRRHNRLDAIQSLHLLWQKQLTFNATNQSYTSDFADLDWAYQDTHLNRALSMNQHYELGLEDCGDDSVSHDNINCIAMSATASEQSVQQNDTSCFRFVLNSNGQYFAQNKQGQQSDYITQKCWR